MENDDFGIVINNSIALRIVDKNKVKIIVSINGYDHEFVMNAYSFKNNIEYLLKDVN